MWSRRSSACRSLPNSPSPFTAYTKQIKEIVVVDPYTIRFKTATPYPLMPSDMTQVAIISKQAAKATTEDFNNGKAAIGTGPYKLVRYAKGDRIELARYDGYWGGKTPWEKVTLRLLPNDASRVAALLAGDVQAIEYVPTSDVARIRADKKLNRVHASSPTGSSTCTWTAIAMCRPSSPTGTASRSRRIRSRMRACARRCRRRSTVRRSSTR